MKKHKISPHQKKILKAMDTVYENLIAYKKKINGELVVLQDDKIIRFKDR